MIRIVYGKNNTEVVALSSLLTEPSVNSVSVIDITYREDEICSLIEWIHTVGKLCVLASTAAT